MIALMDRLHVPDDQPIENKLVSRAIEQAQVKVEGFHFDSRKSVVEYDDVANQHREVIYKLRRKVLESEDVRDEIFEILHKEVDRIIGFASGIDGKVDHEKIVVGLLEIVPFDEPSREKVKSEIEKSNEVKEIKKIIEKIIRNVHSVRESQVGEEVMRQIEKFAYLSSIDHQWVEHLDAIEGLREGVRLRAYGQRDALAEFKSEAFTMFENLMGKIESQVARSVFRIGVAPSPAEIPVGLLRTNEDQIDKTGLLPASDGEITAQTGQPAFANISSSASSSPKKIGRNDPCWCGSGKKWKKCHYPQLP